MLCEIFKEKKLKTPIVVSCPKFLCSQKTLFTALGVKIVQSRPMGLSTNFGEIWNFPFPLTKANKTINVYFFSSKVEAPLVDHLSNFRADEEEYEVMEIFAL